VGRELRTTESPLSDDDLAEINRRLDRLEDAIVRIVYVQQHSGYKIQGGGPEAELWRVAESELATISTAIATERPVSPVERPTS
jgi:hypothetical protein